MKYVCCVREEEEGSREYKPAGGRGFLPPPSRVGGERGVGCSDRNARLRVVIDRQSGG